MDHTKGLNEAQKKAVLATEGPVLVLAGAGAGKTRTIAHRIVHLVKNGTPPERILAITFTNKAAREMRERVLHLLREHGASEGRGRPTVATFHALSVQLLREHAAILGLSRNFTIFDRSDSLRAVKTALKHAGEDEKRFDARSVLGAISRAKGAALSRERFGERAGNHYYDRIVSDVWAHYESLLRKEQALDFDDLLLLGLDLLRKHPDVRNKLNERWRYVHVDEYQDTNGVQFEMVRALSASHTNLFCVGDIDQNVYSWRGSTIQNILDFETHFPDATVLKLEENYRSSGTIIAVSNAIIARNRRRRSKTLFTANPPGEKLVCVACFDERHEAEWVVERTRALLDKGVPASEIAVLYRANFQSRILEDAFLAAGLPHRVLGTRFFDRAEVKDVLSYLRAAQNPQCESDVRRIINVPPRGIGKVTVDKLFTSGFASLPSGARDKVLRFQTLLTSTAEKAKTEPLSVVLTHLIEQSGIAAALTSDREEDQERLQNVRELVSLAATRYDHLEPPAGVERLLEDAALMSDQDELDAPHKNAAAVALMTVHAAKGLEFAQVFITGLEEGLFPHERNEPQADDEEERRLFYVAITRAKERVYFSYAQMRTVFGVRTPRIPSEFLLELDPEYLESELPSTSPTKVVYLE